ncbi:5-formyltetrahydrofolate cyclo-ligase family protein [Hartmannibacter diazotrophicus]|uniref:5-formyltetrahydrofolate cyclo-ligase family protein n=1 Tax=Hartmannibacter diazotrophicus TaxID=1482074 RepID=A0A2C9D8X1_9HYPH|nr:5-formyltetrahydrofolate cyclo-ligase [Hartmannibacter diazotrophicus]SON56762.1 5-formyltetrahydrofolate cyclo-ligase family protein [Hartmannibacter diazotrophicus]
MSQSGLIRQRIWERLKEVARPDTRLHLEFSDVIPDFEGSDIATDRIVAEAAFKESRFAFVTPDNSLVDLRRRMIAAGMPFVMSTYNIRRGFLLMEPGRVPEGAELYAAWLDGMEHFARPVTLAEIAEIGRFDFAVTGASAVSTDGVRFGKGHIYFDLEWGMFTDLGLMQETTPVAAIVHDVQVVDDKLFASETDIAIDMIATPTGLIRVDRQSKRPRGVRWDLVTKQQIADTPPLRELARMRGIA